MDWTATLGFVAAALGLVAAITTVRTERLKGKLALVERDIAALRKFASNVFTTNHDSSDLFVLGPRAHGKTSLVTALTQQWRSIRSMPPTPTHFQHFFWESSAYGNGKLSDAEIGQERPTRTFACLNIYDYAGEEQSIAVALQAIEKSQRYLIAFVMSCEESPLVSSATYFNLTTLKVMRAALAAAQAQPPAAVVLFTKQDASTYSAHSDPSEIPSVLLVSHERALANIETIFGNTTKMIVSAETGFGLATAFRAMLNHVVDDQGLPRHSGPR